MPKQSETFKGHQILISRKGDGVELYLDHEPMEFGRDGSGRYYLKAYAYDRGESLADVVKRFIEYRETRKASAPAARKRRTRR